MTSRQFKDKNDDEDNNNANNNDRPRKKRSEKKKQQEDCCKSSCKIVECLIPHCKCSSIGTRECPFEYGFFNTIYCERIHCKHMPHVGPQGASGPHGPQGNIGLPGKHGLRGWQGVMGCPGTQGRKGIPGAPGEKGEPGERGKRGFQGLQGPVGSGGGGQTGSQGPPGPQGVRGFEGFTGATGSQGVQGPPGLEGFTGPTGPQGDNGGIGMQGSVGYQGNAGPQGLRGLDGSNGMQGAIGSQGQVGYQGLTGNYGPQGIQGPKSDFQGPQGNNGPQGLPGDIFFVIGPQGNPGFQGNTGMLGPQGERGEQGPSGGPVGPQGPFGFQGLQGAFGGPPGPQGLQGVGGNDGKIGPQGKQGAQGMASANEIGPQGSVGAQGMMGNEGPQGPPGSSSQPGNATLLSFISAEPIDDLKQNEVSIDTNSGNFYQLTPNAKMNWDVILNDSFDAGNNIVWACLATNVQAIYVIRTLSPIGTFLYRSLNQGTTFTPLDIQRSWNSVTCSNPNGSVVMATTSSNDFIYVSVDTGETFTPRALAQNWCNVCMSQDGTVAMACVTGGPIYTSETIGFSWTLRDANNRAWRKIVCSLDGSIGFACTDTNLYLSTDFGHNWNAIGTFGSYVSVAMSGNNTNPWLAYVTAAGSYYLSTNLGASFVLQSNFSPALVVDVAISSTQQLNQIPARILILNSNQMSQYSANNGNYFTQTEQFFGFQRFVAMTVDGSFALAISGDRKRLLYGYTTAANTIVFNSLVSNTSVTSKLLTGLTPVPGRIDSNDSLLTSIGKMLFQDISPSGLCIFSNSSKNVVLAVSNVEDCVIAFTSGGTFQSTYEYDFLFDPTTGISSFIGLNTPSGGEKAFFVTATFSFQLDPSSSLSNGDLMFAFNSTFSTNPNGRVKMQTYGQQATVKQIMLLSFGSNIQLVCRQTSNDNVVKIMVDNLTYSITPL